MTWGDLRRQRPPAPSNDLGEARRVRADAEAGLVRAQQNGRQVKHLAESLRDLQRRNHVVDGIRHILVGGASS